MKVKELQVGMRKVEIIVRVVKKGTPRTVFAKTDGRQHQVADFTVGDDTGTVSMSVWDDMIGQIKEDDVIRVNGYITEFRGKIQLNIGKFGVWERLDPDEHDIMVYLEDISPAPSEVGGGELVKVIDTLQRQRGINVRVKVLDQLPVRKVTTRRDEKEHLIYTYIVGDETAIINFVLWDKGDDITVDDVIEIQGGYTREFNKIMELNLSRVGSYTKSSEEILEVNTDKNISEPSS